MTGRQIKPNRRQVVAAILFSAAQSIPPPFPALCHGCAICIFWRLNIAYDAQNLPAWTGNWLDRAYAEQLLGLPDNKTLGGKRDQALLAILLGCGVRREELAYLEVGSIEQRESRWVLVDLVGKGRRVRTVPMPAWRGGE